MSLLSTHSTLSEDEQYDPGRTICSLSWAPDGAYLAVGMYNGNVELWDADSSKRVRVMRGHQVSVIAFHAYSEHVDSTTIGTVPLISTNQLSLHTGSSQFTLLDRSRPLLGLQRRFHPSSRRSNSQTSYSSSQSSYSRSLWIDLEKRWTVAG